MSTMLRCKGAACLCATNEEDDVSVEVDAELNAVDDFLSSPARNPEVSDQSHNGHREKPERDQIGDNDVQETQKREQR